MTDPKFIAPINYLTKVGPFAAPTLADIDGDGDLDAFVGERDGWTVFFRNTGSATAPAFSQQASNFGLTDVGLSAAPTLADIDGDGDLDAFVGNRDGNTVFYRNTGSVTAPAFSRQAGNFGLGNVGASAAPTLADIDGDGDLDAFVGNRDGNTVFYRNTGSATAPAFSQQAGNFGLGDVGGYAAPTFADIDEDGDLDAFVGNEDGNTVFYRNTGSVTAPAFSQQASNFGLGDVGFSAKPTFADINGDGDLDAFVGNFYGNTNFFQNQPALPPPINFVAPQSNPFGLGDVGSWTAPTFADIDSDGDLDAFVGEAYGNTLFYRNTGGATAPAFSREAGNFGLGDVGFFAEPTFVDIDGDGDLDAFVAANADIGEGGGFGSNVFFRNTGSATAPAFSEQASNFGLGDVVSDAQLTFADIDGDGDLDAFFSTTVGNIVFCRNTGSATAPAFSQQASNFGLTDVGDSAALTFADIDGDGDLDAFIGEKFGRTRFFRNTGSATAPAFSQQASNFGLTDVGSNAAPTFADIDGDGDLDAFVGKNDGNTLFFRTNRAPVVSATLAATQTEDDAPFTLNLLTNARDLDRGDVVSLSGLTAAGDTSGITVSSSNSLNINPSAYNSLNAGQNSVITYTYNVIDSNGGVSAQTATITITGVNDVATITGNALASVTEDASNPNLTATGNLTVNDVDAGQSTLSFTSASGNLGSLRITSTATGTFTYTYTIANSAVQYLNTGQTKTETFTVKSLDSTATQDIIITLIGVNDAPTVANPIADQTTPEDSLFSFAIPANAFADVDAGNSLTYTATLADGSPLPTWLTFNGTSFSGTPDDLDVGTIGIKVTATDTSNASVSDTFDLTVTAVNDPPVAGDDSDTTFFNTSLTLDVNDLLANDSDVDSALTIINTLNAINGTAVLNNNSTPGDPNDDTIVFTPKTGFSGTASFDYTVSDGNGGTDLATVLISVGKSIQGSKTADNLVGTDGNDNINGGSGNDTISGLGSDDSIAGDDGNDTLLGGGGIDALFGGNGSDLLVGGSGPDLLNGGNGTDTFGYTTLTDSLLSSFDRITDLAIGTDRLDGPNAVSAMNLNKLGSVSKLKAKTVGALLNGTNFVANGAATFTFSSQRFVALNDGVAGFSQTTDAIIEITGFSGSIARLSIV